MGPSNHFKWFLLKKKEFFHVSINPGRMLVSWESSHLLTEDRPTSHDLLLMTHLVSSCVCTTAA